MKGSEGTGGNWNRRKRQGRKETGRGGRETEQEGVTRKGEGGKERYRLPRKRGIGRKCKQRKGKGTAGGKKVTEREGAGWENSEGARGKGKGGKERKVLPSSSFPTLNPGCTDLGHEKAESLRIKWK